MQPTSTAAVARSSDTVTARVDQPPAGPSTVTDWPGAAPCASRNRRAPSSSVTCRWWSPAEHNSSPRTSVHHGNNAGDPPRNTPRRPDASTNRSASRRRAPPTPTSQRRSTSMARTLPVLSVSTEESSDESRSSTPASHALSRSVRPSAAMSARTTGESVMVAARKPSGPKMCVAWRRSSPAAGTGGSTCAAANCHPSTPLCHCAPARSHRLRSTNTTDRPRAAS